MKPLAFLILSFLCSGTLSAQFLERTVFGCCGTTASIGGFNYSYTIGEAAIGTKNASLPALTIGFQQPDYNPLLPVSLVDFVAEWRDSQALLSWKTLWELNTASFVVERSIDGQNFGGIGIVPAAGSVMEANEYFFPDPSLLRLGVETIFYRLRVVDENGYYSFSQIEELHIPRTGAQVVIYPNPTKDRVFITAARTPQYVFRATLLNPLGQELLSGDFPQTQQTGQMDVSSFPEGTYYLKIQFDDQVLFERIVLKR